MIVSGTKTEQVMVEVDELNFLQDIQSSLCGLQSGHVIKGDDICRYECVDHHRGEYDFVPIGSATDRQVAIFKACDLLIKEIKDRKK